MYHYGTLCQPNLYEATMKLPLIFIFSDVQKQRLKPSMLMPRMEIGGVVLIYNKHAQLGAQLLAKEL